MRVSLTCLIALVLGSSHLCLDFCAADEEFDPSGRWVLVCDWDSPEELAIVDIGRDGGGFEVQVIDAKQRLGAVKVESFECRKGRAKLLLHGERVKTIVFEGMLADRGAHAGQFLGTIQRRYLDPARLVPSTAEKLAEPQKPPHQEKLNAAWDIKDLSERVARFSEIVHEAPGPTTNWPLRLILVRAEEAGVNEEQIDEHLRMWFDATEKYGPKFSAKARLMVLRSLYGQAKFARAALKVANDTRASLSDLSAEDQAVLLRLSADAARLAGDNALAADCQAEANEMDARLDAEYEARTPPFVVERRSGQPAPENHQVVLLELFTGGLCPPCVAADVAFDALNSAFPTTELVLMQYHLHIPGADALANPETIARWEYYASKGVPTALFNGEREPNGGGPFEASQNKYVEYCRWIEERRRGNRTAEITLHLTRSGNKLSIRAVADLSAPLAAASPPTKAASDGDERPKLRLRLALTENVVRYDGGNGVRLNHHVVRHFPGGVEGTELIDGRSEADVMADLDGVRRGLDDYVQANRARYALASLTPVSRPKLTSLALVAFVQDDATKRVLHAVQIPVPENDSAP